MKGFVILLSLSLLASAASAQFTGPSATGKQSTVEQARNARLGSYVSVTGRIVEHQRDDYFTFRDSTGDIRVEIEAPVWQNVKVGPDMKVRLLAEVDQGPAGRYLWVKSLQLAQ